MPLSGDLADYGPPGDKAANVAVDQINKAIKEAGVDHTVKLVTEDNCGGATRSAPCRPRARWSTPTTPAASPARGPRPDTIPIADRSAIREGVLLISPASTSDEITGLDDNGLVNRTAPPDSFQGPTLADLIAEGPRGRARARRSTSAPATTPTAPASQRRSAKAGRRRAARSASEVDLRPRSRRTTTPRRQKIVSGNPDAIVIIDFPETFAKVGPALVRTGNCDPSKTWVTDGLASASLPKDVGATSPTACEAPRRARPTEDGPSKAFDRLYTAADPKDVDRQTFDAQNFDAVMLCYLAAVAAGSTDGTDMADEARRTSARRRVTRTPGSSCPRRSRRCENGEDIDYQGASGAIDMDDNGDATAGVYDIYEYKGGALDASTRCR